MSTAIGAERLQSGQGRGAVRQDIQILRGFAVVLVVLFHLQVPGFGKGFLGVDLFFVISGYLMAQLFDRGSAWDFYQRRIDRLLPACALLILVVLGIGVARLLPVDYVQLALQAQSGALFASNLLFWNQNSYFDALGFNPLLNLWSLAVEVQFYLVVPPLYGWLKRRPAWLAAVLLGSLLACGLTQRISPTTAFFLLPFRVWEFLIGAAAAWSGARDRADGARHHGARGIVLVLLALTPFVAPIEPGITGSLLHGHPAFSAGLLTGLTGLVLALGMPAAVIASLPGRALARVGDASYSIYLVHFPLIVLWNYSPFGGTVLKPASLAQLAALLLAIGLLGALWYRFAEQALARRSRNASARLAWVLAILLSTPLLAQLNRDRFSLAQQHIFAASSDRSTFRCGKYFRLFHPRTDLCPITAAAVAGSVAPRILLLGNSHADSIKTRFAEVAAARGGTVWFVADNGPLIGGRMTAATAIDQARALGITTLVIHYSNIYVTPARREEIRRLVDLARRNGIVPVLIAPVPHYAESVPKALYENDGKTISIDRAEHERMTADFRRLARELEAQGLRVYDPAETLCPDGQRCRLADAALHPYYFDDGHLTLTGAATLVPLFNTLFDDLDRR